MKIKLPPWIKLPSLWIEQGGLRDFRWVGGQGANNLAALMTLMVISHHIDRETGIARLTYDDLRDKSTLSRAKVSAGLGVLAERSLIEREPDGRSSYGLAGYDPDVDWVKFPARGLYRNGSIAAFRELRLRRRTELDAVKLYFLFASRRDRDTNTANITYEQIQQYSGVGENYIRGALSVLAANGLVHIEQRASNRHESGIAHGYRLAHLDPRQHAGTIGRAVDEGMSDATAPAVLLTKLQRPG